MSALAKFNLNLISFNKESAKFFTIILTSAVSPGAICSGLEVIEVISKTASLV